MIVLNDVCAVLNREVILSNFDLSLAENEIYGLFGLNGAGKTTFLRTIAGLYRQQQGEITMNGFRPNNSDYQKQFYYYEFEGFLNHELTPRLYFDYTAKVWNSTKNRIEEAVQFYGIDFLDKKIGKFSMGMKQKTILAMYYISNAPIWLLDEPFNGLDFNAIASLEKLLIEEKNERTIIVSSHLIEQLSDLTNKIIFVKDQEIFYRETEDIESTYYDLGLEGGQHE